MNDGGAGGDDAYGFVHLVLVGLWPGPRVVTGADDGLLQFLALGYVQGTDGLADGRREPRGDRGRGPKTSAMDIAPPSDRPLSTYCR